MDVDVDFVAGFFFLSCPLVVSGLEFWLPEDDEVDLVDECFEVGPRSGMKVTVPLPRSYPGHSFFDFSH